VKITSMKKDQATRPAHPPNSVKAGMSRRKFFGKLFVLTAGAALFHACLEEQADMDMTKFVDLNKYARVLDKTLEVGQTMDTGKVQVKLLAIIKPSKKNGSPSTLVEIGGPKNAPQFPAQADVGSEIMTEDATGRQHLVFCTGIDMVTKPETASFAIFEKK
jgi:hypothetical protein